MVKFTTEITTENNGILLDKLTPLRARNKEIERNLVQRHKCIMDDSGEENCIKTYDSKKL